MKKILLFCALLLLLFNSLAAADYYDKGSQMFSFRVGTDVPLFTYFFSDNKTLVGPGEGKTGLDIGGYGSISYQVFNSPKTAVGGEIGYNFNFSAENVLFTAIPFYAKYSLFPVQGQFDIPLSVGIGGAYAKYNDAALMTFYANVEIGFTWFPGDNWGFGLSSGLWVIPELNYYDALKTDNAIAGFIPVTLSISYRQ